MPPRNEGRSAVAYQSAQARRFENYIPQLLNSPVRVKVSWQVRNIEGSGVDPNCPYKNSWIKHLKRHSGIDENATLPCVMIKTGQGPCPKDGTDGAHVKFNHDDNMYLVPMCWYHNRRSTNVDYYTCRAGVPALLLYRLH